MTAPASGVAPGPGVGDKAAYRRLLTAQVLGLIATGVAVVALGLAAYERVGADAGAVLGTALALKMAVNILAAPLAAALAARLRWRGWLAGLCVARAGALAALPFVTEIWQIYALVAAFQAASAAFTAGYQALTPELLPDPDDYTRAVAKGRIAYEVETLASPLIAAALLSVMTPRLVFLAAAVGFIAAAALSAGLAAPRAAAPSPDAGRVWRLLAAPALRAAILLGFAGTVVGAMVTVNTVVLVRGVLGDDAGRTALALAVFGVGAVTGALAMPRLIAQGTERAVMLCAGLAMAGLLAAGTWLSSYAELLTLWLALGVAATLTQAPTAALLRRHAAPAQRQTAYAAHYAVGHAQLLIAYLAAGWAGAQAGMAAAFLGLSVLTGLAVLAAAAMWPAPSDR
jgi:MFS family permease